MASPQALGVQASVLPAARQAALERASLAIGCVRLAFGALAHRQDPSNEAATALLAPAAAQFLQLSCTRLPCIQVGPVWELLHVWEPPSFVGLSRCVDPRM